MKLTLKKAYFAIQKVRICLTRSYGQINVCMIPSGFDFGPLRDLRERACETEAGGRGGGLFAPIEDAAIKLPVWQSGQFINVQVNLMCIFSMEFIFNLLVWILNFRFWI